MKKMKTFALAMVAFFLSTDVYAVCDVAERDTLNSLAVNVGVSYEEVQIEIPKDENFNYPDGMTEEEREEYVAYDNYFRIYISNITEELYVVVTNNNTRESRTLTFQDVRDRVAYFDQLVTMEIVNYTIEVYSSSETNCPDTLLYTQYLTTPMYNPYSELVACEGAEDFYMCHEYLSVDVDFTDFYDDLALYKAEHGSNDSNGDVEEEDGGFFQFIQEHLVVVIIVVVGVAAAGGLITFVVIKKQRSRVV